MTLVDTQREAEKTEHNLTSLAKNLQSNGWSFKSSVFWIV